MSSPTHPALRPPALLVRARARPTARRLIAAAALAPCLVAACANSAGAPRASRPQAAASAPGPAPDPPAPARSAVPLTTAQACALPPSASAPATGAAPFSRADPHCHDDNPFCDEVARPLDPADTCFVAASNLTLAERQVSGAPSPPPAAASAPAAPPSPAGPAPRYLDRLDAHLHLTPDERARLAESGFVAIDRLSYSTYVGAFHDIFQQQLPVFIGVDAVLHAIFQANGTILADIESSSLSPKLAALLQKLRGALGAQRGAYAAEQTGDLDVYLTVAASLLGAEEPARPLLEASQPAVDDLVARARRADALSQVSLFGRDRMIDFTQFTPRGHYAAQSGEPAFAGAKKGTTIARADYFMAVMWLSRVEFNLASRGCRSSQPGASPDARETPREARAAMALADLTRRAGALGELRAIDEVYRVFAGRREDVAVPDLLSLMTRAATSPGASDADARLRAAIGGDFRRTARVHYMPEGAGELPAIATLLGPRITPDTAPLTGLVHDRVPDRYALGAADVAYVLGHDRAREYLKDDLAHFASLGAALDGARAALFAGLAAKRDLYSLWLGAVTRLSAEEPGARPSFMRTAAYADMRINSALVGYGQIRHNYVLLAAQGYDAYGCEIPDGYVEPVPAVYEALVAYARAAREVDPAKRTYFARVEKVLSMLGRIARTELSGLPLSEPERRWLGMVAEHIPHDGFNDSGEPPKYTGWYFDLFPDRHQGAEKAADFVGDYFTLTNEAKVAYLGADRPRLGLFVVDTGGAPRVVAGPVARGYEAVGPLGARLDDQAARALEPRRAPWRTFAAPAPPEPPLTAATFFCPDDVRVVVTSPSPLDAVTLTLLDHHGDPVTAPLRQSAAAFAPVVFSFAYPGPARGRRSGFEGLHLRVEAPRDAARPPFDFVVGPSVYRPYDPREGAVEAPSFGDLVTLGPRPAASGLPSPPAPAPAPAPEP